MPSACFSSSASAFAASPSFGTTIAKLKVPGSCVAPEPPPAPLAQALFKGAEVGDVIPGDLFGAVAELLAYLVRIRQLML